MSEIKTLIIDKNYEDFGECFEDLKNCIYRKMIETYNDINVENDDFLLMVSAKVENTPFITDFHINKDTSEMFLLSTILPHFESIEDYETCAKIVEIYERINR